MGRQISTQTSPSFWGQSSRAFGINRGGSLIVCGGNDCRCEVSLQSYLPNSVSEMLIFGFFGDFLGFLVIFLWGRDLLTLGVRY